MQQSRFIISTVNTILTVVLATFVVAILTPGELTSFYFIEMPTTLKALTIIFIIIVLLLLNYIIYSNIEGEILSRPRGKRNRRILILVCLWLIALIVSLFIVHIEKQNGLSTPGSVFIIIMGLITLYGFIFTIEKVQEVSYQKITNYRDLFYVMKFMLEDKSKPICSVVMTPATGGVSDSNLYAKIIKPLFDNNDKFQNLNMICDSEDGLNHIYQSYIDHELGNIDDIKAANSYVIFLINKLREKGANIYQINNFPLPQYHFYVRDSDVLFYFPLNIQPWVGWEILYSKTGGETTKWTVKELFDKLFDDPDVAESRKIPFIGFYSKDSLLIEHFNETYKIYKRLYEFERSTPTLGKTAK